jgi:IS605 OrfB family transposase
MSSTCKAYLYRLYPTDERARALRHQLEVRTCDVICHEDLVIKNMLANRCLALNISDAAWGQLMAILTLKAAGAGRQILAVDPRGTSQTCVCGEAVLKDLGERWHQCPCCRLALPRDQVSAMLIKTAGLEMLDRRSPLGSSGQAVMWPGAASVA